MGAFRDAHVVVSVCTRGKQKGRADCAHDDKRLHCGGKLVNFVRNIAHLSRYIRPSIPDQGYTREMPDRSWNCSHITAYGSRTKGLVDSQKDPRVGDRNCSEGLDITGKGDKGRAK